MAVLRLITSSSFAGAWTGSSFTFARFEDAIGIDCRAPEIGGHIAGGSLPSPAGYAQRLFAEGGGLLSLPVPRFGLNSSTAFRHEGRPSYAGLTSVSIGKEGFAKAIGCRITGNDRLTTLRAKHMPHHVRDTKQLLFT